jgi:hypothetical protein
MEPDLEKTIAECIRIKSKTELNTHFFIYSVDEFHFFWSFLLNFVSIGMIYKVTETVTG